MSLHYTETLRGSYFLVESPDDVRTCEISVNVNLPRPKGHVEEVAAEVTGNASFDQLADQVPIVGILRMRWIRPRRVDYEFAFQTNDGRTLHFRGAKHPSLLRPLYTATTLWGTVHEGERALAMVSLHFDLRRDLVAFLQSLDRQRAE
jgi:hypothetical protein